MLSDHSVDRVDVALEMEQWAEQAAQVSAARFSISAAKYTLSTL